MLVIQSSTFVSFVSHGLRVLQVGTFWQSPAVMCLLLRCGFCLATLPCRFSSLHIVRDENSTEGSLETKEKAYSVLYVRLDTKEGEKD